MKIKEKASQYRRDFTAVYGCEHCGETETSSGYDDSYFHSQVIPGMKCKSCGKTSGDDYKSQATKYADHEVV